jgi:hypothetical protein
MFDLEITIDGTLPHNLIHITGPLAEGQPVHITASRRIDADVLLVLFARPVAQAIANAIDGYRES